MKRKSKTLERVKIKITPRFRGDIFYIGIKPLNFLIAIVTGGDNGYALESNICNIPNTEGLYELPLGGL